jgi:hypothetical protein
MKPDLEILSATIRNHAAELAVKEWQNEHWGPLMQILRNAGLASLNQGPAGTLTIDDREVPTERIVAAIRNYFIETRTKVLIGALAARIVADAGRSVLAEEENEQQR